MARAFRPARPTTPPTEVIRLLVDEHLPDTPDRAPQRPAWNALTRDEQLGAVVAAQTPEAMLDERDWLVGNPCRRPLIAAIAWTIPAVTS